MSIANDLLPTRVGARVPSRESAAVVVASFATLAVSTTATSLGREFKYFFLFMWLLFGHRSRLVA